MRRLFSLAAALGLFSTTVGCHCLQGICDCDNQIGMGTPTAPIAVPPPIVGHGVVAPVVIPTPAVTPAPAEQVPAPSPAPAPNK